MNHVNTAPLTPDALSEDIAALCERYPMLAHRTLGKSILGRDIPLLLLGRGKRKLLYVATHHATEWLTGRIVLGFVSELCEACEGHTKPYGIDVELLLGRRMLCFVPVLNPDGVGIHFGMQDDPLAERRARMSEEGDFSHWQANARGVDLNHNYAVGFAEYKAEEAALGITGGAPTRYSGEYPESEPEAAALAAFARTVMPRFVMSLHTQGEEIYYKGGGRELSGVRALAMRLSSLSGYRLGEPSGPAAYGGFCDYTTASLGIPSFTVECGRGENPLPPRDAPLIYARIRRMLFESITM